MKDTMTIADKIFLKQIFPCAKLVISEAAAINVNDKETSTECISDSPIFDDCARALYNLKLEELDFKLKQHKFPLRCAKCFKQASWETNCCEFHVYCDDCSTDPATIAVTCLPKDILAKREIGRAAHSAEYSWLAISSASINYYFTIWNLVKKKNNSKCINAFEQLLLREK